MRPPTPASTKYSCQRQTVVFETPASRMIAMTPWPSAHSGCLWIGQAAVDPARRHSYARDSYSNCGGGECGMVLTLTPEHLVLGNGLVLDGFNQARVIVSTARHVDALRDRPHA